MCIATRDRLPEAELIRLSLSPDNVVTPDPSAKLPGRGAWVRADRASVERVIKKKLAAHAFACAAVTPADLADVIERTLAARCCAQLGLARRSGALAIGFQQASDALRTGTWRWLVQARDAAFEGRRKMLALANLRGKPSDLHALPLVGCFSASDIGNAVGRSAIAHAVVFDGPHARKFSAELKRLAGFRPLIPKEWAVEVG